MSSEFEEINGRIIGKHVWLSFAAAILLSALNLPYQYFFWVPDWVAVALLFWLLNRPSSLGLGRAFLLGLLSDYFAESLLGSHALAYVLAAFFIIQIRKRLIVSGNGGQALAALFALLYIKIILAVVIFATRFKFVGWAYFVSPLTGALLWPLLIKLMLKLVRISKRNA